MEQNKIIAKLRNDVQNSFKKRRDGRLQLLQKGAWRPQICKGAFNWPICRLSIGFESDLLVFVCGEVLLILQSLLLIVLVANGAKL